MRTLKLPTERLEFFADAYLTHAEIHELLQIIDRRVKKRVPAAYLLNEAWLRGYKFYVDERVIVPRSFIGELLDEWPVAMGRRIAMPSTDVLDMCTGSGCLAIMAADVFPNAKVDAVDISADALHVARRNIDDYQLQGRVNPVKSDLFAALGTKRYDIIVCNPPYVTDNAMAKLPPEYTHEPKLALAGGADGMNLVKTAGAPGARTPEARRHADRRSRRRPRGGREGIW